MTIDPALIRQAREAKGWSQERLAREASVSQTTIDKIERGETKRSRFLREIARSLGLRPDQADPEERPLPEGSSEIADILKRREADSIAVGYPIRLPVYAAAEGGPGNLIINRDPLEYIERPYELRHIPKAYAVYIVGESMFPEFEPGDRALVNPALPAIPGVTCIFQGGQDEGEHGREATIKRLVRRKDDAWHVRQWNPDSEFDLPFSKWGLAERVVGKISR